MTTFPAPAPLPELVAVACPECQEGCEACNGTMTREVCGGCGQVSDGGSDTCACTYTVTAPFIACETCDQPVNAATLTDGICIQCFAEGLETIRREEAERSVWIAEQLELGRSYGWLT